MTSVALPATGKRLPLLYVAALAGLAAAASATLVLAGLTVGDERVLQVFPLACALAAAGCDRFWLAPARPLSGLRTNQPMGIRCGDLDQRRRAVVLPENHIRAYRWRPIRCRADEPGSTKTCTRHAPSSTTRFGSTVMNTSWPAGSGSSAAQRAMSG